ncbi:hypothetical protein D1157_04105 [Anaerotruncus sp. X29]|nr:hypothetical protein [Anaerotruncus sp. X29]
MKLFNRILQMVCLTVILSTAVSAYLDPSVMTYTIQVVAGVIVAVGAVIGIYWRRAKKKVQDKLGIDENAKKEVEEDVIVFTETSDEK